MSYLEPLSRAKNSFFSKNEKTVSFVLTAGNTFSIPFVELFSLLEYVNDSAFQPVFLNSFLPLEDQRKCRNILRPPFRSRPGEQCLKSFRGNSQKKKMSH